MESRKAEINALRAVGHHDNIVTLVDVFVDETDVMIVMELCTGGDLFDRLAGDGPRSEERASYHIACLARALDPMPHPRPWGHLLRACPVAQAQWQPDLSLYQGLLRVRVQQHVRLAQLEAPQVLPPVRFDQEVPPNRLRS